MHVRHGHAAAWQIDRPLQNCSPAGVIVSALCGERHRETLHRIDNDAMGNLNGSFEVALYTQGNKPSERRTIRELSEWGYGP
jgi:hypothetical protein